ncbi:hypothetical protein SAMN05216371_8201 [Streptomyces sp. TLI_053]|uniref:hypothetical protein n=1 Tax=Streptomyces sp. TLI_053 TaxID=1855352 RepID=UPI00087C0788|nr:hypothetical protein [Streptomyces sp. TLI_053]SDT83378.1 hypothetical protein SAMN05216371_8201 [Streptomyces sp. TLI_053]
MSYPNEIVIGVTAEGINRCISAVYKSHRERFKGKTEQGGVTVTWDVGKAPSVAIGSPEGKYWSAAIDASKNSPPKASNTAVVQVLLSGLSAQVGTGKSVVSGNVLVHMDVVAAGKAFKPAAIAAYLYPENFSDWDAEAMRQLLPVLLDAANKAMPEFSLPALWGTALSAAGRGVALKDKALLLGADQGAGGGALKNISISKDDHPKWADLLGKYTVVAAFPTTLIPPSLLKEKADDLGFNQYYPINTGRATGGFTPHLGPVDPVPGAAGQFKLGINLDGFSVSSEGYRFRVETEPRHITMRVGIDLPAQDLNKAAVKIIEVEWFASYYDCISCADAVTKHIVDGKANTPENKAAPWSEAKKMFEGVRKIVNLMPKLQLTSEAVTVEVKPATLLADEGDYLLMAGDLEAK